MPHRLHPQDHESTKEDDENNAHFETDAQVNKPVGARLNEFVSFMVKAHPLGV
jgi:hypothetical protein